MSSCMLCIIEAHTKWNATLSESLDRDKGQDIGAVGNPSLVMVHS